MGLARLSLFQIKGVSALFFFSTLHQQIKTNSLLKCEKETPRFHNQVPRIGMFLSFLSILQNVLFKNQ